MSYVILEIVNTGHALQLREIPCGSHYPTYAKARKRASDCYGSSVRIVREDRVANVMHRFKQQNN